MSLYRYVLMLWSQNGLKFFIIIIIIEIAHKVQN